jgi:hypothetical protein
MTNPTSNFGWQMPTSTDLVTDLPADFEVFGQAVDTDFVDLLGGTTGQVLSKTTNTDLDFTWVTPQVGDITAVNVTSPITGGGSAGAVTIGIDAATTSVVGAVQLSDSTSTTSSVLASTPTATKAAYDLAAAAIPKSTVTTSGDVIYATGSSAVTRLGVGSTGQVLTVAAGVPSWASPASGSVNLILNSNFALNQRAYVSAANLASGAYGFDRWKSNYTNTTLTFTASTQGQSLTINASGGLQQVIEQGLVPAGTYTLSWTGTATARVYNSGGTPPSYAASPVTFTADGTANVVVEFTAVSTTKTVSKVQFNAGTGTTWAMATPTLQSELAACQRYFQRQNAIAASCGFGSGAFVFGQPTTRAFFINTPIPNAGNMRTSPTLSTSTASNFQVGSTSAGADYTVSAFTFDRQNLHYWSGRIDMNASPTPSWVAGTVANLTAVNTSAYIDYSSEL